MLTHYFKVACRQLIRNQVFSYVNILGLSVGIAAALIIFQYVYFEYHYDDFHEAKERMYRVDTHWQWAEKGSVNTITFPSNNFFAVSKADELFEGIEARVGVIPGQLLPLNGLTAEDFVTVMVDYASHRSAYKENEVIVSTPSLFDIFSFRIISGERDHALENPNSVVLSESAARKYFGNMDAVGQIVEVDKRPMKVTAVFEDIPAASSLRFDIALSMSSFFAGEFTSSQRIYGLNYIRLRKNEDVEQLAKDLVRVKDQLYPAEKEAFKAVEGEAYPLLRPLTELHLLNDNTHEYFPVNSKLKLKLLLAIACLILVIAWVNYVNMVTARSVSRIKEVGIRKVVGAGRLSLVAQFFGESLVFNLAGLVLAITLSQLVLPYLGAIGLAFSPDNLFRNAGFWLISGSVFLAGCIVSSLYPALVISSYSAKLVLSRSSGGSKGRQIRTVLLGLQFAASVGLIVVTFIIDSQIDHVLNKKLGFDKEQTLVLRTPFIQNELFEQEKEVFKDLLLQLEGVSAVTGSWSVPGDGNVEFGTCIAPDASLDMLYCVDGNGGVDYNFADFYGIKLLAGRNFIEGNVADRKAVLVSRRAAERMGFSPQALVGRSIYAFYSPGENMEEQKCTVIGVYEDYQITSLHKQKESRGSVLTLNNYVLEIPYRLISVKFQSEDVAALLAKMEALYREKFPESVFDYFFLDRTLQSQYAADMKFRNMVSVFSLLAIVISVIGLYGLVSITTIQKTKEIGIRKVLGAKLGDIFSVISRNFIKLYVAAVVLILPLVWYLANQWLDNYESRIKLSLELFLLPALALFLVIVITIGMRVAKVGRINPSQSLRYE